MKIRKFALHEGEPARLRVESSRSFFGAPRDTRLFLDDLPLEEEGAGSYRLPDGTALSMRWVKTYHGYELHLHHDGQPVPGSEAHPQRRLLRLATLLYVV